MYEQGQNVLAGLIAAVPNIIAFVVILIIGWFIASLIAKGVTALLHAVKFNELAKKSGFADLVHKMGIEVDASGFLALIVKWFIRLIVLIIAVDALGLPAVSNVLEKLWLWLPKLIVAMVVLVLAGLGAQALSKVVRGIAAKAGLGSAELLAKVASTAVWIFAIVIAANMLSIAPVAVNTVFIGLVAAMSLALGLAFGLGGKEVAGEGLSAWQKKAKEAAPKVKEAQKEAKQEKESAQPPQPASIKLQQQDKIAEKWTQIKPQLKARWSKLTDQDLDVPHGNAEYVARKLQERYGETPEQAQREVQEFSRTVG